MKKLLVCAAVLAAGLLAVPTVQADSIKETYTVTVAGSSFDVAITTQDSACYPFSGGAELQCNGTTAEPGFSSILADLLGASYEPVSEMISLTNLTLDGTGLWGGYLYAVLGNYEGASGFFSIEFVAAPVSSGAAAFGSIASVINSGTVYCNFTGDAGLETLATGTFTDATSPSTVPEPASLMLLGTGLLGAVRMARRKAGARTASRL